MTERWRPNVTVAAVIERDGRFLLVEELTRQGLRLNNPAGHLEPGESLVQACVREVREETAHAFRPTHLVGVYLSEPGAEGTTYLRFAFCGELGAHAAGQALDSGIERTLWLTFDELQASEARHRSPLLMRGVRDYLAGARHPLALLHP